MDYVHTLLIMEDDHHDTDETGDMIAETETAGATCITTAVPVSSAGPFLLQAVLWSIGAPVVFAGQCHRLSKISVANSQSASQQLPTLQSYVWILMSWKCASGTPVISEMIEKIQVHVLLGKQNIDNIP